MTTVEDRYTKQYKGQQQKKNAEPESKESVYSDYTNLDLDKGPKDRITLEPIPEEQRDRKKEKIFRDKMYLIAGNVFKN